MCECDWRTAVVHALCATLLVINGRLSPSSVMTVNDTAGGRGSGGAVCAELVNVRRTLRNAGSFSPDVTHGSRWVYPQKTSLSLSLIKEKKYDLSALLL